MKTPDPHTRWYQAQGEFAAALSSAGLSEAWKKLAEENAYIRSGEEHHQDQRRLVFSLDSIDARKRIIRWDRECHQRYRAVVERELADAWKEVRSGGARVKRNAVWSAMMIVAAAALLAGKYFGLIASVAAAAAGVVYGFFQIRESESAAQRIVEDAKREAAKRQELLGDYVDPPYSESEEATGEPDHAP